VVMMKTDRPHARRSRPELKQLLRYPDHLLWADKREPEIAVANNLNSEFWQQGNSDGIEGISRGNPDFRRDSFLPEDLNGALQLVLLLLRGQSGKLAFFPEGHHAGVLRDISMLEPMDRDCPPSLLPLTHVLPKILHGGVHLQSGILVVWNNCEHRLELVLDQGCLDLPPYRPVHGRTKIIEAQEIMCGGVPHLLARTYLLDQLCTALAGVPGAGEVPRFLLLP